MPRKKNKSTKPKSRLRKTSSFLEKSQVGISLTTQALDNLNQIVKSTGLSKSHVFEGFVTGNLAIASQEAEKTIAIEAVTNDSETTINKIAILEGANTINPPMDNNSISADSQPELTQAARILELEAKLAEQQEIHQTLEKHVQAQDILVAQLTEQAESQRKAMSEAENLSVANVEAKLLQLQSDLSDQKQEYQSILELRQKEVVQLENQLKLLHNSESNLQSKLAFKVTALKQLEEELRDVQSKWGDFLMERKQLQQEILEQNSMVLKLEYRLKKQQKDHVSVMKERDQISQELIQQRLVIEQIKNQQLNEKTTAQLAIAELRSNLIDAQRLARIGEVHLNKWRKRNFS